jgi:hypothetical protein
MNDNSAAAKPGFSLRPSLDWLLVFIPISIALRFVPGLRNDTALFITACLAIIPLAVGWGALQNTWPSTLAKASAVCSMRPSVTPRNYHRADGSVEGPYRRR